MRPDKKGKRKPHPGQQSGGSCKPKGTSAPPPNSREISHHQVPQQPNITPPAVNTELGKLSAAQSASQKTSQDAAAQGPRILDPVAAEKPLSNREKYGRREIHSNWSRYEEPVEPELEPDQDYTVGETFETLLQSAGSAGAHFSLRSERSWLEEAGKTAHVLRLDAVHLSSVLQRLPLHSRLGIATKHFTEEELIEQSSEAERRLSVPLDSTAQHEMTRRDVCQRTLQLLMTERRDAGDVPSAAETAAVSAPAPPVGNGAAMATTGASTNHSSAGTPSIQHPATLVPSNDKTIEVCSDTVPSKTNTSTEVHANNISSTAVKMPSRETDLQKNATEQTSKLDPELSTQLTSANNDAPAELSGLTSEMDRTEVGKTTVRNVPSAAAAPLLDEDWLDSVLSDED